MTENLPYDPDHPLECARDENLRKNKALRDYALMGPGRSIRKLCAHYESQKANHIEPPTRRLKTLLEWSSTYSWQNRVAIWEKQLADEDERRWQERRQKLREDEWEKGQALMDLAKDILEEGPKFVRMTRRYDKANKREIITLALDGRMAVRAIEAADRLMRLAAGMETEHQRHSGTVELVQVSADDLAAARDAAQKLEDELLKDGSGDE